MSTTTISNISITPDGPKPPAEIKVTVTADIENTGGKTPQAYFPAQSMGTPMTNSSGSTWTASDTEMYDSGEKTIKIECNGVHASKNFKP